MEQYKTCKVCNVKKALDSYHKAAVNSDGHRNTCKTCTKNQDAARYASNPARQRERALAYYHAHKQDAAQRSARRYALNRQKISEKRKQHRQENIWEYKKKERASYQRNKQQKRKAAKDYEKRFPEKSRLRNATRRAKLKQASIYQIAPSEIKRLYSQSCLFCGATEAIDLDHAIPLSRGGRHSIANLIPLCDNCNSTKYNKTIMEWRVYRIRIGKPLPKDRGIVL